MKPGKKHDAYADVVERVLTLDLAPGAGLDESTLAEHYGLSRTPMREVLQQLAGEGYLTLTANRGAAVASMDLATMRTFFQTAPMIYAATTRLAAENGSAQQLSELKDIQARYCRAFDDDAPGEMVIMNHRFHEKIGEMAGNLYLSPSLKRLLIDHTRMSQTFYRPRDKANRKRIDMARRQHDQIIDAIAERSPAEAVALTLDHWELSRGEIEKYVRPDPLPLDGIDTTAEAKRHAV